VFLGVKNPQKTVSQIGRFSGSESFKNRLLKTWIFQCLKSAKITAKKQLFSRQKHTKYLQKSIFLQVFWHHFILFCTLYHRNFRYFCHKKQAIETKIDRQKAKISQKQHKKSRYPTRNQIPAFYKKSSVAVSACSLVQNVTRHRNNVGHRYAAYGNVNVIAGLIVIRAHVNVSLAYVVNQNTEVKHNYLFRLILGDLFTRLTSEHRDTNRANKQQSCNQSFHNQYLL
jgi:hypothetical protein